MNKKQKRYLLYAIKNELNKRHIKNITSDSKEVNDVEPSRDVETISKEDTTDTIELPKKMNPPREEWEKLGFVFEENKENENVYNAYLPLGYKVEEVSNSNRRVITNELGIVRATIYSKGSVYSEDNFMTLNRRFGVQSKYSYDEGEMVSLIYFGDNDQALSEIYKVKETAHPNIEEISREASEKDKYIRMAEEFGDTYYPDWRNYDAYWDELIRVK